MQTMVDWLEPFFSWIWRTSWQASVVIGLVLLAQWVLRKRLAPRWRHGLWLLVIIRLALPWSVETRLSLFNWVGPKTGKPIASPALSLEAAAPAALEDSSTPATASDEAAPSPTSEASITPSRAGTSLQMLLPWIWLSGVVALPIWLLVSGYKLNRRIRHQRPVTDGAVLNLLEDCKQEMGVRTPLLVVETPWITSPCLFGFIRPRLLLPEGLLRRFSPAELRYVFLHELSHVKRCDIAMNWLMTAALVLHWFNPVLWFAVRRMRADRELACDALALSRAESENRAYGQTIIKLLEDFSRPAMAPGLVGILENSHQMKGRISMIAKFKKTDSWPIAAAVVCSLLAVLTLTDAQSAQDQDGNQYLQQQLALAKAGNYWAKYKVWDAYYRGKNGVAKNPEEAGKWVAELVKGVYVAKFEPVGSFNPRTPGEMLDDFSQRCRLFSGKERLGSASFFRTKRQGDKLLGSFLTESPDTFKSAVAKNSNLKLISVEKLTPEVFLAYEASSQESFETPQAQEQTGEKYVQQQLGLAKAGNSWAKYNLWDAYARGNHDVTPNPKEAEKWVAEFVKGLYVAKFEPVGSFNPTTPKEMLDNFSENCHLFSGRNTIGAASFFRTKKQGDKLIGSFLTESPDTFKSAVAKNPSLKLISVEKLTPEVFLTYEASSQESL